MSGFALLLADVSGRQPAAAAPDEPESRAPPQCIELEEELKKPSGKRCATSADQGVRAQSRGLHFPETLWFVEPHRETVQEELGFMMGFGVEPLPSTPNYAPLSRSRGSSQDGRTCTSDK